MKPKRFIISRPKWMMNQIVEYINCQQGFSKGMILSCETNYSKDTGLAYHTYQIYSTGNKRTAFVLEKNIKHLCN